MLSITDPWRALHATHRTRWEACCRPKSNLRFSQPTRVLCVWLQKKCTFICCDSYIETHEQQGKVRLIQPRFTNYQQQGWSIPGMPLYALVSILIYFTHFHFNCRGETCNIFGRWRVKPPQISSSDNAKKQDRSSESKYPVPDDPWSKDYCLTRYLTYVLPKSTDRGTGNASSLYNIHPNNLRPKTSAADVILSGVASPLRLYHYIL